MQEPSKRNTLIDALTRQLEKIRPIVGGVSVSNRRTDFVLAGAEYTVAPNSASGGPPIVFWFGVNERRLFFICYLDGAAGAMESKLKFCFGGAAKVGWDVNYEPIEDADRPACSVWATCMAPGSLVDVQDGQPSLTKDGQFWVTDVAMMVQSLQRTAARSQFSCLDRPPEPL